MAVIDFDPRLYEGAIERFAGYQIIGFYEAYRRLGGTGDPDLMPVVMRKNLVQFLLSCGYRERWASEENSDDCHLMWVRGPWPIDYGRSNEQEKWVAVHDIVSK